MGLSITHQSQKIAVPRAQGLPGFDELWGAQAGICHLHDPQQYAAFPDVLGGTYKLDLLRPPWLKTVDLGACNLIVKIKGD